ncbi:MAG: capsid assembly protein [bacterium]
MSTSVEFTQEPTGPNAPATQEPATPGSTGNQGERPDWLPQEFNTVEDFVKSAKDTKAALTQSQQELARIKGDPGYGEDDDEEPLRDPTQTQDDPEEPSTQKMDDAAKKAVADAGFDAEPYVQEFAATGDVTPENRDKIAEGLKGILGEDARTIVDEYVEAKKVGYHNDQKLYMEAAGGAENYGEMVVWAKDNWSPGEIQAYNKAVNSGDRHTIMFAIEGLKNKYEAVNGRNPNLIGGGNSPRSGAVPYSSTAEMTRDMQDPRYKTDEAFREQVKRRIAAGG